MNMKRSSKSVYIPRYHVLSKAEKETCTLDDLPPRPNRFNICLGMVDDEHARKMPRITNTGQVAVDQIMAT